MSSQPPTPDTTDVLIIGAGLSGLCCARTLTRAGIACSVFEAQDHVGGRVSTDIVDGFRLERGFQVFLTAYPEAQSVLDYKALDLRPFEPGAMVFADGRLHTLMDPWRRPLSIIDGALARVGSLADKLRMGSMRSSLQKATIDDLYAHPERTTLAALQERGFSTEMIDRFFRPFFGGVFFDRDLTTSSRAMEMLFRLFSLGDVAVPARGMQAIPEQIAASLPAGTVHLSTPVSDVQPGQITLASGAVHRAKAIVVACPGAASARWLPTTNTTARRWRSTTSMYFAGPGEAPVLEPILLLDGQGTGPAINVAIMSQVAPDYAPPGPHLVSCAILGNPPESDAQLQAAVREQMSYWFGPSTIATWRHLRTQRIAEALPDQSPPWMTQPRWPARAAPGLYRAGDTIDSASIDGAMRSGRHAAEAIIEDLNR